MSNDVVIRTAREQERTMTDTRFRDDWLHLMGDIDELLRDVRNNAAELADDQALQLLVTRAEHQRTAAHAALLTFHEQRQTMMSMLDQIQQELAVAGRPLRGEIS
jgi:hypothetical protein